MFERATDDIIALAAAAASAMLFVFAGGFAIYAAFLPMVGSAWSAAIVAGFAFLISAAFWVTSLLRKQAKEREKAAAHNALLAGLPANVGEFARERPLVTLAVSLVGGLVAARNPSLVRDLISIAARMTGGRER